MFPLANWQTWSVEFFIAVILVTGLMLAITALAGSSTSKPRKWRDHQSWRYPQRWRSPTPYQPLRLDQKQGPDLTDVGQQLHAVMAGSFEKQRVLSNSEYRIFAIIEAEIKAYGRGYRVFAQTSLGEILRSKNEDAFRSINSKRVDILIIDRAWRPYLAVEYQGDNPYQGTAAARDAVKKEALRKAGVRYMEFCATDTDDKIRSRLREHLAS
jgi:hypothetical protein